MVRREYEALGIEQGVLCKQPIAGAAQRDVSLCQRGRAINPTLEERAYHTISNLNARNTLTERHYLPHAIRNWNHGLGNARIEAFKDEKVSVIERNSFDLNENLPRRGRRLWPFVY